MPLVAAGAGVDHDAAARCPQHDLRRCRRTGHRSLIDLLTGAAGRDRDCRVALPIVFALPAVHTFFHRLRNPLVYVTLGGLVLGLLGAIGGELTLFKGLAQTGELLADVDGWGIGTLILIAVVKLAALLIAAASGFRGGRIFPAVFIGVTLGLLAHDLLPSMPVIARRRLCGVLGVTLTVARDGWVARCSSPPRSPAT